MADRYIIYKKQLLENQLIFKDILHKISQISNFDKKLGFITSISHLLSYYPTNRYVLPEIEAIFIEFAQLLPPCVTTHIKEKSVLHVMTEPYHVGGHTRVVERWIEQSACDEKHSVVFTRADNGEASTKIKNLVSARGGGVFSIYENSELSQKAFLLKQIASSYEVIILHTHPEDYLPLLAFGAPDFKRPVILFNHADHIPWYGISVADIVAEFRSWGMRLTENNRACSRSFLLGLPQDTQMNEKRFSKEEARQLLNVSLDEKIILTIGSPQKYQELPGLDFSQLIHNFLNMDDKNTIISIGMMSGKNPYWDSLQTKYPERLKLLGYLDRDTMFLYIAACDIVIDSFPMSGCIALMDALSYDKPVLSLECPVGQSDFILNSPAYCASMPELLKKAAILLKNKTQSDFHVQAIKKVMSDEANENIWQERVGELYQLAHIQHSVYPCTPDNVKMDELSNFLSENNITDFNNINDKSLKKTFYKLLDKAYSSLDVYRLVKSKVSALKLINEDLRNHLLSCDTRRSL